MEIGKLALNVFFFGGGDRPTS